MVVKRTCQFFLKRQTRSSKLFPGAGISRASGNLKGHTLKRVTGGDRADAEGAVRTDYIMPGAVSASPD